MKTAQASPKEEAPIVDYRVPTESERDVLFRMILDQLGGQSEGAMAFLGMTAEQFAQVYRATGEVRVIRADGDEVGYLWIEERDRALHVHAIILCSGARGQGIGTRVLQALQHEFSSRVDAIELGVQDENTAAIRFYERAGFQRVPVETAPGFSIMRLPL
jgi:ribosomal protein S18 acetylase RimI-like enzyme